MMRMNSKSSVFDIFSSESWSKKASRKKFRQQEVMSPLIDETVCLEGASLFPKITLAEQDESHGSSAFYYNVSIHRGEGWNTEGVVMIK
jgi:hypothetical protein